jgi:hypothetical protein
VQQRLGRSRKHGTARAVLVALAPDAHASPRAERAARGRAKARSRKNARRGWECVSGWMHVGEGRAGGEGERGRAYGIQAPPRIANVLAVPPRTNSCVAPARARDLHLLFRAPRRVEGATAPGLPPRVRKARRSCARDVAVANLTVTAACVRRPPGVGGDEQVP